MTLALLPVANGLDWYFDLFGEGRLRQPATRAHVAYELRWIAVVDRFFAAVRKDFDDPPVGFQPYPHHGRYPFDDESANELADSRPQFVNAEKGCYAGQDLGYRLASRLRPNSADPKRRDSATEKSLTGQNRMAKKIATGTVATPISHRCADGSNPKAARTSNPRTENDEK